MAKTLICIFSGCGRNVEIAQEKEARGIRLSFGRHFLPLEGADEGDEDYKVECPLSGVCIEKV